MHTQKHPISAPSLEELVETLQAPLAANYEHATISVVPCPDLRNAPFHLATEGLSGDEKIADVGGQANLFPRPRLDCIYPMPDIAKAMEMSSARGSLIGAGAGPFHVVGQNCELAPNLSWQDGFENINNQTRIVQIRRDTREVNLQKSTCPGCALMVNLYGSLGEPGPVIKITAKKRKGPEKSFTECIRKGHDFEAPIVCLSVLHSADPEKAMGLRIEHTHCFSPLGENAGGHYHYDVNAAEEIGYEAYFNAAKVICRIDMPEATSA